MWWESSVSVQFFQVWIARCGGSSGVVNSSGLMRLSAGLTETSEDSRIPVECSSPVEELHKERR